MVDILKGCCVFQSQGRKPQRPVHYQLGVFLMRYGISGSHARHPKLLTSIGEGTVVLYCRRVIRAIREHGLTCVVWPSEARKVEIKRGFKKVCGLDDIIGTLDGTHCGLETKPREYGDSYISRKKTLSVSGSNNYDYNDYLSSTLVGQRPGHGGSHRRFHCVPKRLGRLPARQRDMDQHMGLRAPRGAICSGRSLSSGRR
jgi:hypothetical protein